MQKYDVNGATAAIINDSKINVAKNESLNPEIIYSLLELVNKIKQANWNFKILEFDNRV